MFHHRNLSRSLKSSAIAISIVFTSSVSAAAQPSPCELGHPSTNTLEAHEELNKGVKAYKDAHYDEAICDFQRATQLDPDLLMAKQYLATALAQNLVPGLTTPDNLKTAEQAIDMFQQVLAKEPHDVNSMKQVAGVYYSTMKLDDAREWQKKVLLEDPKDAEAAYTIGVIDWIQAHQNVLAALTPAGLFDDGEGNAKAPPAVLAAIKTKNSALVDEGLQYLNQALEDRPNYDDAMAYINLAYRRKADVDYENPALRAEDVAEARRWANKAMATRKANQEKRVATPNAEQP